jgi:hypothetical protein
MTHSLTAVHCKCQCQYQYIKMAQTKSAAFTCTNTKCRLILSAVSTTPDVTRSMQPACCRQHSNGDSVKTAETSPAKYLTGVLAEDQLFFSCFHSVPPGEC